MFYNASLQKIELHDGIKRIGAGAFTGCSQLKEIVLPEHIDTLPDHVFQGSGLTSITIPKKVQRIEGFAFDRCENLVSVVFDRDSELDYIGHDCFSFSGLKAFEVPESVSLIENYVFSFCGHLEHFECFRKTKLRKNALSDTRLKPVEQGEKLIWEAKKPKWMNMVDWKMIRAGSLNFQHRREAGKEALKSVH